MTKTSKLLIGLVGLAGVGAIAYAATRKTEKTSTRSAPRLRMSADCNEVRIPAAWFTQHAAPTFDARIQLGVPADIDTAATLITDAILDGETDGCVVSPRAEARTAAMASLWNDIHTQVRDGLVQRTADPLYNPFDRVQASHRSESGRFLPAVARRVQL